MKIDVSEESITALPEYAGIPIAYEVSQVLTVDTDDHGGFVLSERQLETPYIKDCDALEGEGPMQWARHFDLSNWGFFMAQVEGRRVGRAAVAFKTANLTLLEGRADLAVLWDIRVSPEARGQGVGIALFQAAEAWAATKGCKQLKIETQNTNVPACRFYEAQGCVIGAIDRFAYPQLPNEIQVLWYKNLSPGATDPARR